MIRIAVSLAAYEAIAASLPMGETARAPEPLPAGEGVGLWLDQGTHVALTRERTPGESYSEVILRLMAIESSNEAGRVGCEGEEATADAS